MLELYTADEAFMCGTTAEVPPIGLIDRFKVGEGNPGPVTRKMQRQLLGVVYGVVAGNPE